MSGLLRGNGVAALVALCEFHGNRRLNLLAHECVRSNMHRDILQSSFAKPERTSLIVAYTDTELKNITNGTQRKFPLGEKWIAKDSKYVWRKMRNRQKSVVV